MKNFKIVLATLLIATLGIAVSSFTIKSYNSRAFATVCYKVNNGVTISVALINAGNTTELSKLNDANGDGTPDANNWHLIAPFNPATDCPSTSNVCAICFDPGTSGKTLVDVLTELRRILANGTFTYSDGATFTYSGFTVTVYEFDAPLP